MAIRPDSEETTVRWNDMPARWYGSYERGRPGYPPEAVDVASLPSSATVLDLGAGTGKLTRLLVSTYRRVVAVEPDDEMRRHLAALCPAAEVVAGSAEQIPLPDASMDAVFAAQSFHWFANETALAEITRALRPRGALIMMWNVPAGPAEPTIAAAERLLAEHWPKGWDFPLDLGSASRATPEWRQAFAQSSFEEIRDVRLPNPQTVDPEGLVAFFDSMGWIAALPDAERVVLLDRVRSRLTSPEYRLPWETHVHWTRLGEQPERSGG
jgi:SAM-dependent methyltransferase